MLRVQSYWRSAREEERRPARLDLLSESQIEGEILVQRSERQVWDWKIDNLNTGPVEK